jgi:hypothetical protein
VESILEALFQGKGGRDVSADFIDRGADFRRVRSGFGAQSGQLQLNLRAQMARLQLGLGAQGGDLGLRFGFGLGESGPCACGEDDGEDSGEGRELIEQALLLIRPLVKSALFEVGVLLQRLDFILDPLLFRRRRGVLLLSGGCRICSGISRAVFLGSQMFRSGRSRCR